MDVKGAEVGLFGLAQGDEAKHGRFAAHPTVYIQEPEPVSEFMGGNVLDMMGSRRGRPGCAERAVWVEDHPNLNQGVAATFSVRSGRSPTQFQ